MASADTWEWPDSLDAVVAALGPGGTQVLIEEPSGNTIELFTPRG